MKLEIDAHYLTASGESVGPIQEGQNPGTFHGKWSKDGEWWGFSDGRHWCDPSHDLVEEGVEEGSLEIALRALTEIACLDDLGASAYLEATGCHSIFDEPGSVEIARKALRELGC